MPEVNTSEKKIVHTLGSGFSLFGVTLGFF